ncbi:hypothetical protein GK675_02285 [Bifidobacteriaceae bacterium NR002]|nr:hypothetical protein [Bifidobacteriaceae bacterium NR002]MDZ7549614.1 hypothetical protein [Bifidobacteriaceae bacterium NR047]
MREAIISAVIICWLASVSLFLFSLFISLRFLFRFQKIASKDSVNSVDYENKNIKHKRNSMRLMPWSIVITHCCGLPCAMLSYMLLNVIRNFGFVDNNCFLLMNSTLIPSYVIIIVLIFANISTMVFCSYINLKN